MEGRVSFSSVPHLFRDVSVFIDVVQVEGPVQLLLDRPSQEDGEAHDEILRRKTRVAQNDGQNSDDSRRQHFCKTQLLIRRAPTP